MTLIIRQATQIDQGAITAIVRLARINPFNLRWTRFLVAEEQGVVVGVGQVRLHADGSRELASIAVLPSYRQQGIGSRIVEGWLARETETLYLFCVEPTAAFYKRFGFRIVGSAELPRSLARRLRLGNLLAALGTPARGRKLKVVAMRRNPASAARREPCEG